MLDRILYDMTTKKLESNQEKVKKCFPCVVLEMAQHTTGKWKKHPHTTIKLAVKGIIDQQVFEEILKGLGDGYYSILEIGYKKKTLRGNGN